MRQKYAQLTAICILTAVLISATAHARKMDQQKPHQSLTKTVQELKEIAAGVDNVYHGAIEQQMIDACYNSKGTHVEISAYGDPMISYEATWGMAPLYTKYTYQLENNPHEYNTLITLHTPEVDCRYLIQTNSIANSLALKEVIREESYQTIQFGIARAPDTKPMDKIPHCEVSIDTNTVICVVSALSIID